MHAFAPTDAQTDTTMATRTNICTRITYIIYTYYLYYLHVLLILLTLITYITYMPVGLHTNTYSHIASVQMDISLSYIRTTQTRIRFESTNI